MADSDNSTDNKDKAKITLPGPNESLATYSPTQGAIPDPGSRVKWAEGLDQVAAEIGKRNGWNPTQNESDSKKPPQR